MELNIIMNKCKKVFKTNKVKTFVLNGIEAYLVCYKRPILVS
jgi:hypothetical protein